MNSVAENVAAVREQIESACLRAGRDPASVRLVGVTKTVDPNRVREAVNAGVSILGENYVQEALEKMETLADLQVSWHFIGHLQTNKAGTAVRRFDWIHTVDREKLAVELDRQACKQGRRLPVLIEVELGGEATKSGVVPEELLPLARRIASLDGLELRGLMALPPYLDAEEARPYFRQLRGLLDRVRDTVSGPESVTELSMGMSHDFEVAIEEGATLVRVGTALFGSRPAR